MSGVAYVNIKDEHVDVKERKSFVLAYICILFFLEDRPKHNRIKGVSETSKGVLKTFLFSTEHRVSIVTSEHVKRIKKDV